MTTPAVPTTDRGTGEVFDLGYQNYEGPREGVWRARKAIWRDGLRVMLGLGRSPGQKVAPFGLIAIALIPAVFIVVLSAFVSSFGGDADEIEIPSFAEYYGFALIPLFLFAAVQAPELLCPDRRNGVLALYLVRPIKRSDYVASRALAFLTVALVTVWVPQVVLFIWEALQASSPDGWLGDNWDVVPRFLAAGAVIALVFGSLSLFASSFTTRRAYAAILTLGVIFVGAAIGGIAEDSLSGTEADILSLAALPQGVDAVVTWIFGEPRPPEQLLPSYAYAVFLGATTFSLFAGLIWRYQRVRP